MVLFVIFLICLGLLGGIAAKNTTGGWSFVTIVLMGVGLATAEMSAYPEPTPGTGISALVLVIVAFVAGIALKTRR